MSDKDHIEKLLYLLGEENAIEELKYPKGKHKFSEKYERRKLDMIKKYNSEDEEILDINSACTSKNRGRRKKVVVLAAAVAAALGISLTAYGAVRMYNIAMNKDEETGTIIYNINSDVNKIPVIKIIPKYIPEGYIESKNAPGKYHLNDDFSLGGITICSAYTSDKLDQVYVSNVEDTTIGGIKAQILTRDGMEYNRIILLFFEDDSQIIEIYASEKFPDDELIKVAENITYEVVPGEFIDIKANSEEASSDDLEFKEPIITSDYIFNIGEEKTDVLDRPQDNGIIYTVDSIEVMEKSPENLDPKYFRNYNEYIEALNSDGTLKEYERVNAEVWKDNKMVKETEVIGMKFVYVTLTMRNPMDEEQKNVNVYPRVTFLEETSEDSFIQRYDYWGRGDNNLLIDNAPIYFDKSDYEGRSFYFCDFAPNETKEIHLLYPVDEDHIDDAYISFNLKGYGLSSGSTTPVENYIKISK